MGWVKENAVERALRAGQTSARPHDLNFFVRGDHISYWKY